MGGFFEPTTMPPPPLREDKDMRGIADRGPRDGIVRPKMRTDDFLDVTIAQLENTKKAFIRHNQEFKLKQLERIIQEDKRTNKYVASLDERILQFKQERQNGCPAA